MTREALLAQGFSLSAVRSRRRSIYPASTETVVSAQGPPKSGKVRSVPLIDQAAKALDGLSTREHFTEPDDLVFCSTTGQHLDDSPIRDAFYDALTAAGLGDKRTKADPIVFHDLRHTFGTLAVEAWPLHDVQAYMGHADIQTTMIYVHHTPKTAAADALTRIVEAASGADNRDAGPEPGAEPLSVAERTAA